MFGQEFQSPLRFVYFVLNNWGIKPNYFTGFVNADTTSVALNIIYRLFVSSELSVVSKNPQPTTTDGSLLNMALDRLYEVIDPNPKRGDIHNNC